MAATPPSAITSTSTAPKGRRSRHRRRPSANSGPVERRVNHIKMIKGQMFGRSGLPLLRKRILVTAQNQ